MITHKVCPNVIDLLDQALITGGGNRVVTETFGVPLSHHESAVINTTEKVTSLPFTANWSIDRGLPHDFW